MRAFHVLGWLVAWVVVWPGVAHAVCRVIEPPADGSSPGVQFDEKTTVAWVLAPDQVVDYRCPTAADGGTGGPDAGGVGVDSGVMVTDGGTLESDAGPTAATDAGPPDPTVCPDGTPAAAVRDTLVHAVLRPALYARGGTAALVMPVPARADVHVGDDGMFEALDEAMVVRVRQTVRYTEDSSLGYQCGDPHYYSKARDVLAAPLGLYGCAADDGSSYYRPEIDDRGVQVVQVGDAGTVQLEQIPVSDDYDATVLNASSLDALLGWLDDNGFAYDDTDRAAFGAYVGDGSWFVALEVHPADLGGQHIALQPLVVSWRGDSIPVMNRLQFDPAGGIAETDAFVMAPTRMAVENGDGTTEYAAPAVFDDTRLTAFGLPAGWLTRVRLVRQMQLQKEDTRIVPSPSTEVVRPVVETNLDVRIAAACCADGAIPSSAGTGRTFTDTREFLEGQEPPDDDLFYTAPSPDPAYCPPPGRYYGSSGGYACTVGTVRGLSASMPLWMVLGWLWWRRRRTYRSRPRRG